MIRKKCSFTTTDYYNTTSWFHWPLTSLSSSDIEIHLPSQHISHCIYGSCYQWLFMSMCQYYNLLCWFSIVRQKHMYTGCVMLIWFFTYLTNFFTCKSKSQFVNILHWYKVCHPQISLFYFILISLDLAINWYWYDSMNFFKNFQHKLINSKREEFIT